MAEENILDIFQGATKNLCNSVLDQVQDAVVWLEQGPQGRLLEQGRRADVGVRESAAVLGRACFEEPALFVDFGGVNVCRDKCPVAMTLKDGAPRPSTSISSTRRGSARRRPSGSSPCSRRTARSSGPSRPSPAPRRR